MSMMRPAVWATCWLKARPVCQFLGCLPLFRRIGSRKRDSPGTLLIPTPRNARYLSVPMEAKGGNRVGYACGSPLGREVVDAPDGVGCLSFCSAVLASSSSSVVSTYFRDMGWEELTYAGPGERSLHCTAASQRFSTSETGEEDVELTVSR